jgi:8-oxo-dGTP diphosphatase
LSDAAPRLEVVAAVILRADGKFLLAQRPSGTIYAGYWEIPGGKVEIGESAEAAVKRELHEELAIDIERVFPWITRDYDYAHAKVRLRFFRVVGWRGEPYGREAQRFSWQSARELTVSPLLPANGPVLRALGLPSVYGISNAAELGMEEYLRRLERALARGLRLFQIREKQLQERELHAFAARAMAAARRHGARMLVNGSADIARELNANGVHLTSAQLMKLGSRPAELELVGASCHNAQELARAAELGVDFVVLGPVLPTPSHIGLGEMGWNKFKTLIGGFPLPVYALGGMREADAATAWQAGAHGISMMRGAWED